MNSWQRWFRRPQSVWVRKAIFQVHLWVGIAIGVYVLLVCISGSALVFRPELAEAFPRGVVIVSGSGPPLSDDRLTAVALLAYPGYQVSGIWRTANPNAAVEVWLDDKDHRRTRLFDPFTGEDVGDAMAVGERAITWLLDLHDNLLFGETGRRVNGVGGLLLLLLGLTGAVVWWPGIKNWRRSLSLHRGVNVSRFTWELHSAVGFWTVALILMWAITGFYLVFQESFAPIVDYIEPVGQPPFGLRRTDEILAWLARLHFGRFNNLGQEMAFSIKMLWVVLGIAPAILSVTGGLIWWNRVIRKSGWRSDPESALIRSALAPSTKQMKIESFQESP